MSGLFTKTLRPAILAAGRSHGLRHTAERLPVTRKVVHRFVPGATLDSVLDSAAALRDSGRLVSIDYLGEDVTDRDGADATMRAYLHLLDALGRRPDAGCDGVRPLEVSLKLSALGQALDRDGEKIAHANAHNICERAEQIGAWVTVDAEDHTTTDSALSIVADLRTDFPWLGVVLQAYLRRTHGDCEQFAASGARVRLCKGAYDEPASVAYRDAAAVTASYLRCLRVLMAGPGYPMVASHDPAIIDAVSTTGTRNRPKSSRFRIPDVVRRPRRRAVAAGICGQPGSGVRAVRHSVVRVFHAATGRAAGQPDVLHAGAGRARSLTAAFR